jgi:hypothetical protein
MSKILFTASDLVRFSNGSIDTDSTMAAFEGALSKHVANVELETTAIADAVMAVFDRYPGARVNMPFLISQALQGLNVQPENSKSLTDRVHAYVQENSDQGPVYATDANGKVLGKGDERVVVREAEADGTRLFNVAKGKGGGISLNSDVVKRPTSK